MKSQTKMKSTAQLNAAYQKASPSKRRVLIARDALKQLKAEKFRAVSGVWAGVEQEDGNGNISCPMDDDPLQPLLLNPKTKCTCCGVGAIFLSYVRLANNATYSDGYDLQLITDATGWPRYNIRLIELAFERGHGACSPYDEDDLRAVVFGKDVDSDTERNGSNDRPELADDNGHARLVAILKNIAASKDGLFHP